MVEWKLLLIYTLKILYSEPLIFSNIHRPDYKIKALIKIYIWNVIVCYSDIAELLLQLLLMYFLKEL